MEIYDMVMRNVSIKRRYSRVVFIDDFAEEADFYGSKRIKFSSVESFRKGEDAEFAITLGEPSNRKILREKVTSAGYRLATLVADSAIVSPSAEIGEGCIVFDGSIVSTNVKLGRNCYVIFCVIIGHGVIVGEDSTISSTAIFGGNCIVGEETFVGMNAAIMQRLTIGSKAIIGMGAMVFRDVESGATMVGNPARASKGKDEHKVF
ncbi:MAG: acetyltransferase [Selenomonadaceae bacterium]|nr:acetyltransferase [Selenomonadaceae bacterium]